MADAERSSPVAIGLSIGLGTLAALFWVLTVAILSDLGRSDAAGNAIAQAYAAIAVIALWVVLAVLALVAAMKGAAPKWALGAAAILIPASGFATMVALDLLSRNYEPPFLWPLVTPLMVPPLVLIFCFWALLPSLRGLRFTGMTPAVALGAIALACLVQWPLVQIRMQVVDQRAEVRAKYAEDFAKVPPGAPLWEWTPFLDTPDETRVATTLDRIKGLDSRQKDAELMLERGDFPLGFLGRFDLNPDASLCEKARAQLRRGAAQRVLTTPNAKPYKEIALPVADAVAAISWLVGYDCSCDGEALAWETTAKAYTGSNYDIYRLAELREPKELGRLLRESPEHFSMLNERSHLKAWLKFADARELREQALAGARKLDHRTADAVDMLHEKYDISAPWKVVRYLPELDFEATPDLCGAALAAIHTEMAEIYRPTADDPRPYRELLARLGNGAAQLPALQWLASHGCNAEANLTEAQALIATYQDSPDRAAMLASLERLHRK
jgi:hypothetical protein